MEILQPNPTMSFEEKCAQLEAKGWILAGYEGLTQTKFSEEAKFEEIHFQTKEEIIQKYEEKYNQGDGPEKYEIQLVLNERVEKLRKAKKILSDDEYQDILANLHDKDKSYIVYVRQKKSSQE